MNDTTGLLGVVGMAAVITLGFMFMSARAITVGSGPRVGPGWARFFADDGIFDRSTSRCDRP